MINCSNCGQMSSYIKSVIVRGEIKSACEKCSHTLRVNERSAKSKRDWQKIEYRKDSLQPNEKGFVRAYGADTAREWGYDEETIRRNS